MTEELEQEFIPFEVALALKELGFDKTCFAYFVLRTKEFRLIEDENFSTSGYSGSVDFLICTPLYQQAFKFFRDKGLRPHNFRTVFSQETTHGFAIHSIHGILGEVKAETYEEAELLCIKKMIEIVQEHNKKNGDETRN